MSKNTVEIPYTEGVERVMSLGRVNANAIEKVRGIFQDIYTRDIPTKHDWQFLFSSSAITTTAQYNAGNASVNTGSNVISFSTDVTATSDMVGRKIKFAGNEVVYDISSFMTAQSLQIFPAMQGATNILNGSYTIFQPTYSLASDFDRFPKDGGIYKWTGGSKERLPEEPYQEYTEKFTGQPSIPDKIRIVGTDTAGNTLIEFRPAPKDARVYSYDYLRRLMPMLETTAGLIKGISANTTFITGQTNCLFVHEAGSDSRTVGNLFFRIDIFGKGQDSRWNACLNVASNSDLTLRTAFGNSAVTTANYTLCTAPQMPPMLHPAVIYGTLAHILADQNDPNAAIYMTRYAQVLSDAKIIYVSRTYSQDIHGIQEEWNYRR